MLIPVMKAIEGAQRAVSETIGCCAPLTANKVGVALRAGLEAALKPRERVFPLRAAIPDAKRPESPNKAAADSSEAPAYSRRA